MKRCAALALAGAAIAAAPFPSEPVVALHAGLVKVFAAPGSPSEAAIAALAVKTFDMPAITLVVLGDAAKTATPSERSRLSRVLVQRLARQIALAGRQTANDGFSVVSSKAVGVGDWLVTTREQRPAAAGAQLQAVVLGWRVRREGVRYRIVDNLRDGLSTVGIEHDDFAAELKGRDLDTVIAQMERRAAAPRPEL